MTQIKVNIKGKYDTLECTACGGEENQQHVILYKELNENRSMNDIKYENICNGTFEKINHEDIPHILRDHLTDLLKCLLYCHRNGNILLLLL